MTPRKLPQNGFWTKLTGIVVAALIVSFFGWLGLAVVQIKVALAGMDTKIESLIETRRDHAQDQRQNTGQRLNQLEGGRR